MDLQQHSRNIPLPTVGTTVQSPSRLTSMLKFLVVLYLVGMLILSVEQFLALPQNLTSGDFWNFLFIPICWLYLIHMHRPIRFPYALGILVILLGSFIGTLFAYNPMASIIFIAKEVYLYIWFVTLVAVFASLELSLMRRILLIWLAVAILHGVLLVAEFTLDNVYRFMLSFIGSIGNVKANLIGRPTGLFENPVWAALFELMGFVPLLLGGLRRELSLLFGMVLLLGILSTASLGSISSLTGASVVAILLLLIIGHHIKFLVWLAAVVTLATGLFIVTISQFPHILANLQHLTTDRAAHTAGERLFLWEGGTEIIFSPKSILGVGPDNYRDFLENKTLHNDLLEFIVERGVIGLLGLALLTGEAWSSAATILLSQIKSADMARPSGVIFIAMLFAFLLESNAHQIFHFRTVWLGLALLESTVFRLRFPSIETARSVKLWDNTFQSPEKSSTLTNRRDPSSMEMR